LHLEEKFDGLSLKEWVEMHGYGEFKKVNSQIPNDPEKWFWNIPEEKIEEVTNIFLEKDLLITVEMVMNSEK